MKLTQNSINSHMKKQNKTKQKVLNDIWKRRKQVKQAVRDGKIDTKPFKNYITNISLMRDIEIKYTKIVLFNGYSNHCLWNKCMF